MASANKTPILNLPQWLGNEYMERTDWNTAFATLEDAIATFDHLCQTYGSTTTYPDADTGTITCTLDSTAPVTATRTTVVSESDGTRTYVETTTIDGTAVTRTWTEGTTTASEVITDE